MDKVAISTEDLKYQLLRLHEDQRPLIAAVDMALAVLSTTAVALRLFSRRLMKAPLMVDDYTVIVGLFLAYGLLINAYIGSRHGLGQHAVKAGFANLKIVVRVFFAYQVQYTITTFTIKTAVLLLYRRIFTTPRFRKAINAVFAFNVASFLSFFFTVIFQCKPVRNAWENPNDPRCIQRVPFFKFAGASSLVTDAIILMLPMFVVWKLNTSRRRKLALTGMFLLGGFVCVAAIARLPYLTDVTFLTDPTWRSAPAIIWSNIESCIGIVCACLPTLRPFVRLAIAEPIQSFKRKRRSRQSTESPSSPPKSPTSPFKMQFPWRKSGSEASTAKHPSSSTTDSATDPARLSDPGRNPTPPPRPPRPEMAHLRYATDLEAQRYILESIRQHTAIEWSDSED